MSACFGRAQRSAALPLLAAAAPLRRSASASDWEPGDREPIIEGALGVDTPTLGLSMLFYVAGLVAIVLSLRAEATREAGRGSTTTCCSGSIPGMVVLASRREPGHAVRRLRAAVDPAVRAVRL